MILIYCDGSSRGNPGPSAIGYLVYSLHEGNKRLLARKGRMLAGGDKTNNYAEYQAVIHGLREAIALGLREQDVVVFSDSKLVVRQVTNQWMVFAKSLKPLNFLVKDLSREFKSFQIKLIPRKENKLADALAKGAYKE